jgi:hypothetical protein
MLGSRRAEIAAGLQVPDNFLDGGAGLDHEGARRAENACQEQA